MDATATQALAEKVVESWKKGERDESLFAPGATAWHNTDGQDQPMESREPIRQRLRTLIPDFRFDDAIPHGFEGGFVIQYVVRGTLPDGSELSSPACMVGTVNDGLITRVQEYIDSAHMQKLRAAFAGGGQ